MAKTAEHAKVQVEDADEESGARRVLATVGSRPEEASGGSLDDQLDRLSLQRALVDFEVANARVIDLTHRYVEATEEIKQLRHDLETLKIEHARALADIDQMRGTRAYRTAERIWALRRALNV